MAENKKEMICFVISPIGEEGTDVRKRADQVLNHIITPAAKECGYETIRADKISKPGLITSQVIQHLLDDPLVIADLTGRNPNVFYELAVRHAVRKPCVQIIQMSEPIPFDVAQSRTIQVDHTDLDSASSCRKELIKQIHSVKKDPTDIDTPISVSIDLKFLQESKNPLEKSNAEIITILQELNKRILEFPSLFDKQLRNYYAHSLIFSPTMGELKSFFDDFNKIFDYEELPDDKQKLINEIKKKSSTLILRYLIKPELSELLNELPIIVKDIAKLIKFSKIVI